MAELSWYLSLYVLQVGEPDDFPADWVHMDPALWGGLPEDVLFRILSKLPVYAGLVSQKPGGLTSISFPAASGRGKTDCSCYLWGDDSDSEDERGCDGSCWKEDAVVQRQQQLLKLYDLDLSVPVHNLKFGAAHRGFLCFYTMQIDTRVGHLTLYLCNPLRETWTLLPTVDVVGAHKEKPQVLIQEKKIIVVISRYVYVYSRKRDRWKLMDWSDGAGCQREHGPVVVKGIILQLNNRGSSLQGFPLKEKKAWDSHNVSSEDGYIWLLAHEGSAYIMESFDIVGSGNRDTDIWEVDPAVSDVDPVEVATAPRELSKRMWHAAVGEHGCPWRAVSLFGAIVLCAARSDSGYVLAYRTADQTWVGFSTSSAEAMALTNLFPFAPNWNACRPWV